MSPGYEPHFVPSIQTSPSVFDDTQSYTSEATSPDDSLGSGEDSKFSTTSFTRQDKRSLVTKCQPTHGTMLASNDVEPRLGFGKLDINSIVNYGMRPKTPDVTGSSTPTPTYARMRLATPPHTPEPRQLGLSAGLDHAVALADLVVTKTISNPFSAEQEEIPRVHGRSSNTYASDIVQSSRRKFPAPGLDSVKKDTPGKISPDVSTGGKRHAESTSISRARSNEGYAHLSEVPLYQSPRATTGFAGQNASDIVICAKDATATVECQSMGHNESADGRKFVACASFEDKNDRYDTTRSAMRSAQKSRTVTDVEENRYLDILRAAVLYTSGSDNHEGSRMHKHAEMRPATPKVQSLATGTIAITPNKSAKGLQTKTEQGAQSWFSCEETASLPSTPKGLSRARREDILASLNDICTNSLPTTSETKADPRDQPAFSTVTVSTRNTGIHIKGEIEPDEDDETGGCSVFTSTLLLPARPLEAPMTSFSRKVPSLAEQQIQDVFRAQVQQAATFGAQFQQFQPICNLTKEQKFDNLLTKIQSKNLFAHSSADGTAREVHSFVDMSNIFIGFQDTAKTNQGLPSSARVTFSPFSFEHLAFVLERGRKTVKRRLAGSVRQAHQMNNLPTHIVEAQGYGYECKILHQVVKLDLSQPMLGSPYTSGDESRSGILCPRTKLGEQGVDEALHLSMQDSILDAHGEPGIMVLGTGDAKPAEYSDGFAHYAIKALKHGWQVEVVSWRKCLSSEWKKSPFKDRYAEQFRIIVLDDFFDEIHANWSGGGRPSAVLARA
ncbi:hypothetical protein E8E14_011654 [Neopestalotiopsis sp. 37M]|nr:hypothetical protein E8E14_011654 [Neopestalotiopsis sp. 37M]